MSKRKENRSNVGYPYFNIAIDEGVSEMIGVNLSQLYLYIDTHKNMGSRFKYGNAYRVIKKRVNDHKRKGERKVSKRQIASLRKYYTSIGREEFIKMPYSLNSIFKAIFEIVNELKSVYPLPNNLEVFIGKIRREVFYDEQSKIFDIWYRNNRDERTRNLHDDIFAGNAILSKKF